MLRPLACLLAAASLPIAPAAELITTHLPTAPSIAVPRAEAPPAITADPDDQAWAAAVTIPRLVPAGGGDGFPTEVHLLWNAEALYLRFRATDASLHLPFGTQHDAKHYLGDVAELFLDPVGDARQYYELQVTPAGGVFDLCMILTGTPASTADGVLDSAVRKRDWWSIAGWDMPDLRHAGTVISGDDGSASGWIVDLAIPAAVIMKRLGGGPLRPVTMRANLARYDWSSADGAVVDSSLVPMYWAAVRHGCPHISPLAMGQMTLLP